jgi:Protein of unknown function (DUF2489).
MRDNSEEHREYLMTIKKNVVDVCRAILQGDIDIISGTRKLAGYNYQLFDGMINDDFLPIVSFHEQTDDMPIGDQRQYYSKEFLSRMDKEYAEFETKVKQEIFDACHKLIERYSSL